MTAREMIDALKLCDPDAEVALDAYGVRLVVTDVLRFHGRIPRLDVRALEEHTTTREGGDQSACHGSVKSSSAL